MKALIILSLLVMSFATSAKNRDIRIQAAVGGIITKTRSGSLLVKEAKKYLDVPEELDFHCFNQDDYGRPKEPGCRNPYFVGNDGRLKIHIFANNSWEYLNWIVFQSMKKYVLVNKLKLEFGVRIPNFVEIDKIVIKSSMVFWDQTDFKIDEDTDKPNELGHFSLSLRSYLHAWNIGQDALYSKVEQRSIEMNGSILTIEKYLSRDDLTEAQRSMALHLQNIWQDYK